MGSARYGFSMHSHAFARAVYLLILASQLPVSCQQEQIGDPTLADGIHDRLVHNAHRVVGCCGTSPILVAA